MKHSIAIFLLCQLLACSNTERQDPISAPGDTVSYQCPAVSKYIAATAFGIISRQQIAVELMIEAERNVIIAPSSWELFTNEGTRSVPVKVVPSEIQLQEGQKQKIWMVFDPVHNLQLYQRTGLRGDLTSSYKLEIRELDLSIAFSTDPQLLVTSIDSFGQRATTTPYILSAPDKFHEHQKAHFDIFFQAHGIRKVHNMQLAENEILINGLWTKFEILHRPDTVFALTRIVNQSGFPIQIKTADIKLLARGTAISPVSEVELAKLPDGERVSLLLRFPTVKLDSFSFDFQAVRYDLQKPVSFFALPLTVTKLDTY